MSLRVYRSINELIDEMSLHKQDCEAWFSKRKTLSSIITDSVGGNTFRAFNIIDDSHPSKVFREWATNFFKDPKVLQNIIHQSNETNFDELNLKICSSLKQHWDKHLNPLSIHKARKLVNLLLKEMALLHDLTEEERQKLTSLLHIPIDKYTLQAIREIFNNGEYIHDLGKIPSNASMGYIDNDKKYNVIQDFFKKLANQTGAPLIYFDVLLWNVNSTEDELEMLSKQKSSSSSIIRSKTEQTDLPIYTYCEFIVSNEFGSYSTAVKGIVKKLLEEIAVITHDFRVKQRKGAFAITPADRTKSNAVTIWTKKSQINIEFFNEEKKPYFSQEQITQELIEKVNKKLKTI
jgi:hypothetical protein